MTRIALLLAIMVRVAFPETKAPLPLNNHCGYVLESCQNLVDTQDQSIQNLKAYSKKLETALDKAEEEPLVPTWLWVVGGIALGGALGYSIHK